MSGAPSPLAALAVGATDAVLVSAPVGYWLLDEATGTVAVDSSGAGHPGTYGGSVAASTVTPGRGLVGSRLFAGGGCDGVDIPDVAFTSFPDAFSTEAWVKTSALNGTVFRRRTYGYFLGVSGGKAVFQAYSDPGGGVTSAKTVSDGLWHHIVGVRTNGSPSELKIYVDGVLDGNFVISAGPSGNQYGGSFTTAAIGRDGFECNNIVPSFVGNMAAVALFNRALNAAEAKSHYDRGSISAAQATGAAFSIFRNLFKRTGLTAQDPVNTATGSMMHETVDLSVASLGVGMNFTRTYDSRSSAAGSMGAGWAHSYDQKLTSDASGAVSWTTGSGAGLVFAPNVAGGWLTPPGSYALLRANSVSGFRELVDREQNVSTFDAAGKIVSIKDRSGQGLVLTYDASNRLSTVTDSAARVVTLTYGTAGAASGKVVLVKGSDLRQVSYTYVTVATKVVLDTVTDVRGKVFTNAYDLNGFVKSITGPLGSKEFTNTYDTLGRVVSQADATGAVSTFVWDDVTEKVTFTDAALTVRIHDYSGNILGTTSNPVASTATLYDADLNVKSYSDERGWVHTATYDGRGNMLTRKMPAPFTFTEAWTYDALNNPLTYKDYNGNTTVYTYDALGRLKTETKPSPSVGVSIVSTWNWNPDGTLLSFLDPRGKTTSYLYDASGNQIQLTDPTGAVTKFTFDGAGRVLTMVEPRGNVAGAIAADYTTTYTYDTAGQLLTVKDALGRITTSAYDNAGNRTSVTAPDALTTNFTYTVANEIETVTAPDGGTTTYTYDDRGLTSSVVAPDGAKTTMVYDNLGRLWKRIDPRGNVTGATAATQAAFTTAYTYDASGRPTSTTTPTGLTSSTQYSESGYVQAQVSPSLGKMDVFADANGNTTAYGNATVGYNTTFFDTLNRVRITRDRLEKVTSYIYDQNGNTLSVVSPLNGKTTYTYDDANRVASMVEPRGNVTGAVSSNFATIFTYDIAGNRIKVRNPLGQESVTTYDRVGNVSSVTDPRGNVTSYTYDAADRVKTVTAPTSGTTTYNYANGRLISRIDALTRTTTYTYDLVGRLKSRTDPLGRKFTYDYDVSGNMIKTTDAIANATLNAALGTTVKTYDTENRLTSNDFSDATPDVSFGYNAVGQLASMTDGQGTETYTYGTGADVGRLKTVARNATNRFSYTYNLNGDITQRWNTADATFYTYDDDRRIKTVRTGQDATKVTTYTYDVSGNPTEAAVVGNWKRTTTYDPAGRAQQITHTGPQSTAAINQWIIGRDPNGNPTSVSGLESKRALAYDAANRLTQDCVATPGAAMPCTTAGASVTDWTFDAVGNRKTETGAVPPVIDPS